MSARNHPEPLMWRAPLRDERNARVRARDTWQNERSSSAARQRIAPIRVLGKIRRRLASCSAIVIFAAVRTRVRSEGARKDGKHMTQKRTGNAGPATCGASSRAAPISKRVKRMNYLGYRLCRLCGGPATCRRRAVSVLKTIKSPQLNDLFEVAKRDDLSL